MMSLRSASAYLMSSDWAYTRSAERPLLTASQARGRTFTSMSIFAQMIPSRGVGQVRLAAIHVRPCRMYLRSTKQGSKSATSVQALPWQRGHAFSEA